MSQQDRDETGAESIVEPEDERATGSDLTVPDRVLPTTLHLLPVFERPFFPAQTYPLVMDSDPWTESIQHVADNPQHVAALTLVQGEPGADITADDLNPVGTAVRIHSATRSEEKLQFIAEGLQRFRIVNWISRKPPFIVQVEYPEERAPRQRKDEVRAYAIAIINTIKELLPLNPLFSEELKFFVERFGPHDPSRLADFAASMTSAESGALQGVLETFDLSKRMEKVLLLIRKELEVARLQSKIRERVEDQVSERQRRFFLQQQLKEIQKELGLEKDDRTADVERFQERLQGLRIPDKAQERIEDEMQKLAVLETGSPEYSVTRNWLDLVTTLPWGRHSKDKLELKRARRILDRDHDGLEDVKDRIIEFLAVGSMRGEVGGSILLLVGPPGVGKTSIGRSVADALGREFYRFSLGGMRDEAEIKGHRRTYIGAMPGKFIQAFREAGTANPVIMLDEIDKVGSSFHGDPASALLEVLDPEQNSDFLDHYLDLRFDLSKALFICTANQLDTIPGPLLDRMEVIRLSGYIAEEKVAIAKHHLWPRQLERAGLRPSQVKLSDAALRMVIDGYAEAGVRNLEKRLGGIIRKATVEIVKGAKTPIRVSNRDVERYLGKPLFYREKPISGVGVITGLAWTAMGGATLSVEATLVHSKNRGFKLTGQLGEVMRESAEIAYSYIASHLKDYAGDPAFFDEAFVHLHVPEGATPKDGPSAGITMATALLSLARGQRIKRPLAMTGELTLTGHVFPVGGIREKVIAARRSGIFEVILPDANRRDFEELPDHIRKGMTAHFVKRYRDVVPIVFG